MECPPHFLFVLPKRKRAGHGTKEKALGDELTGEAVNSPIRRSGRYAPPTKSRTHLPAAPMGLPRRTAFPHLWAGDFPGCKTERLSAIASCVPLRYALLGPISREGFPKGRDRSPAPLCHEGAWGTGGVPHVSGGGLRGRGLCAKGPFPLPRSGNCPLREQTVLSDFQIK